MTLSELLKEVEVHGKTDVCYYDYEAEKRVVLSLFDIRKRYWREQRVLYIYVEGSTLYIELENEGKHDERG